MSGSDDTCSIAYWVERINKRDLAAMTATVRRVQSVVADENSSLLQLSEVLQLDPTLSAKLLRIANSPSYAVTADPVTTVTRAVALIGYDAIRNICITSRLLESLLAEQGLPATVSERLLSRTAASLHAAIQARMILSGGSVLAREEVFLGALLKQIGESAFWGVGGPQVEALDAALREPGCVADWVVTQHIGGSFIDLSRALIASWGLEMGSGFSIATTAAAAQPRSDIMDLGNEIADCVCRDGWYSRNLDKLCERVAVVMNLGEGEAAQRIRACGQEAEEIAYCYGVGMLAQLMSHKPKSERLVRPAQATTGKAASATGMPGDPAVQLAVLRDMRSLLAENPDINTIMRMAMDGIHAGIGMSRTVTALLAEDRKSLKTRFWLGEGGEHWSKTFRFEVPQRKSILHDCINANHSFRYSATAPGTLAKLVPVELMRFCTGKDFLLAPILVGARSIGAVYADRALSETAITEADFNAFTHFAKQLGMCLAVVTQRKS